MPILCGFLTHLGCRENRPWSGGGALPVEYERLHLVATMPARRHPLRSHIVTLFRRGDLVSVQEAVLICDASRQAISKWLKLAGIDIEATRMAYVARQRRRAQLIAEGRPPRRRPSKAELRSQADKAVREFHR